MIRRPIYPVIRFGLKADYTAFIDKRQLQSLRLSASRKLVAAAVEIHPAYADAELTGGACEYLLGSLPFFVRWFVRFDGVEGRKRASRLKSWSALLLRGAISVRSPAYCSLLFSLREKRLSRRWRF